MPPMIPPAPRPIMPGFQRNDNNAMPNTGWRSAYSNPGNPTYTDPMRPSLPGFYISDPNNISARDVPMDGSISFFPASDLSYIIIKQWNGNGMISEAKYIPAPVTQQSDSQKQDQDTPDDQGQQQTSNQSNSEIVEVISAALNEQTQRLTAAFSQIGMAFTTLQEKLDNLRSPVAFPTPAPMTVANDSTTPSKKLKSKPAEVAKDEKD